MKEKANYSAGTEELLTCPLPLTATGTADPYHHLTTQRSRVIVDFLVMSG